MGSAAGQPLSFEAEREREKSHSPGMCVCVCVCVCVCKLLVVLASTCEEDKKQLSCVGAQALSSRSLRILLMNHIVSLGFATQMVENLLLVMASFPVSVNLSPKCSTLSELQPT